MASVLNLLFVFVASTWALDPSAMTAIDHLIDEVKLTRSAETLNLRSAATRLEALEKLLLPVAFTFNRLSPLVMQRNQELDRLQAGLSEDSKFVNPYVDKDWVAAARKETAYICCEVRRNPKLAQEIQENLANGIPALSQAMSDSMAGQARQTAKELAVRPFDDEPVMTTDIPRSSPRTIPRMAPKKEIQKGRNTGIISGLPVPAVTPVPAPAEPALVSPSAPPPSRETVLPGPAQ